MGAALVESDPKSAGTAAKAVIADMAMDQIPSQPNQNKPLVPSNANSDATSDPSPQASPSPVDAILSPASTTGDGDIATQQEAIESLIPATVQSSYDPNLNQLANLSNPQNSDEAMQSAANVRTDLLAQAVPVLIWGFDKQQHVQDLLLSVLG